MNLLQKYLILTLFSLFSMSLNAQLDTTVVLDFIEVKTRKIRQQPVGGNAETWNVNNLQSGSSANISELLANESGAFIKNYGLGSLSTSSLRGGNAGHTLVLWNGLPVQSPMLGLLDLSLLPTNASESVTLQRGGNSALWGSGAIGGVVSLENKANFLQGNETNINLTLGSFELREQQFSFTLSNARFQSRTKIFHREAQNDFSYFVADNLPRRKQTNARLSQQNLMQDFYWKMKGGQQFSVHLWQQFSDRQIPPTNVQNTSIAYQLDRSFRGVAEWQKVGSKVLLSAKTGFFDEDLDYFNERNLLASLSNFQTVFGEFNAQVALNHSHSFHFGTTQTYTKAEADGYQNAPTETKSALFVSYRFEREKFQLQTSLRDELVNGKLVPLVPVLGMNFQILPNTQLKGKVSKNYRLPTMNDRFWQPGGNENLLPESGWSEELTLETDFIDKPNFCVNTSLTIFNRNIINWIWWTKKEGESYWSADNIAEVWSRGLEARLSVQYSENDWKTSLKTGYDYVRSTNVFELNNPNIAAGSQLFYTPVHRLFANLKITKQYLSFTYRHQFTSETNGLNESLASYFYADARLLYNLKKTKLNGSIFLNVNNLWNTDYFVIERRPMPGRHFQVGLTLNVNQ